MARLTPKTVGLALGGIALFVGSVAGGIAVYNATRPPQVAVVKTNPEGPTLRPVQPKGPVIILEEGVDKGKTGKTTKVATKPKPAEKLVGVGPERKLPVKGEKRGLTMYANLQVVTPTLYRIDVASGSNGVKEPGKGFFKIKPRVVKDRARPFVDTEGVWMSEDPPIYFVRPRDHQTPLPDDFTIVYVRNGVYYPVDLFRTLINGRDDVVARKIPGDKNNTYVSLPQDKR